MKPLAFRVDPTQPLHLADYDTNYDADLSRKDGSQLFNTLRGELDELQELLYATNTHRLLIILQGMDTAGKDGVIRKVFGAINPIGCRIQSFKAPTADELAHDFLWRVHHVTPRIGEITIFNRSHYEDVLIVRVHQLVPRDVWLPRYEHINQFERFLVDNNTLVVKFFLHISRDEQKERLLAREKEPRKAWKLSPADWEERRYWDDYQAAYTDVLTRCSTSYAPWYIVPANRKWFRNVAIVHTVVETLRPHKEQWLATLTEVQRKALDELRHVQRT